MIRRWGIYLAVLAGLLGLYAAASAWITWMAVLTAAGSPLVSVAVSAFLGEQDLLGLFRLPRRGRTSYDCELRPFRPGDSLCRVHWKQKAKTGMLMVREERALKQPKLRKSTGILPVALCFLILFCLFPPGRYGQQMGVLQGMFRQKAEVRLDLTTGPRIKNKQPVLDAVASQSQVLYLRGQTFDVYDGTSWRASKREDWSVWEPKGTVEIAARRARDMQFAPYYGAQGRPPKDCLQLPKDTRDWAQELAEGKTAAQIQNYVRSCARYDENPETAPQTDFVRWFLEESGRGYCVHFATTAAVLLRAADIPARLVTGYAVNVQAGLRKTVTGEDAHAWVEYWDGAAWRILEATPTMEAGQILPAKKENRREGGVWLLILAALAVQELSFRKYMKLQENPRIKELKQKAAFSRDGLSEVEGAELEGLLRQAGGCGHPPLRSQL